jgi:monothiol glutaredoxin
VWAFKDAAPAILYNACLSEFHCITGIPMDNASTIESTIRDQINSHAILLYMKGNPNQPQCGFSARASQILMACGQKFAYVDILSNPEIRANLPKVSDWPTFPQLFVDGELVGGCDIMTEMYESGELKQLLDESAAKREQSADA